MVSEEGQLSPSGVWIASDFRSNLIIDRYDPVFADMRASKIKHLRSVNSEDAITWNVFRSLRQVNPTVWLPTLWQEAFPSLPCPEDQRVTVRLWAHVPPPLGLLLDGDEGLSEVDVIIEAASWVWFIEVKFRGDISSGTTNRPDRDQILRNIDVGTHYAGVRRFFFSLLISSEKHSPRGMGKILEYQNLEAIRDKLVKHRGDRLMNLQGLSHFTWEQIGTVLTHALQKAEQNERPYAHQALNWMRHRGLLKQSV